MQVKSIAECPKGSILQFFPPSLSYHLSLRSLFCLFLSGRFTQVLLYNAISTKVLCAGPNHLEVMCTKDPISQMIERNELISGTFYDQYAKY